MWKIDYQSYGGISRGVVLEKLPKHYIRQMHFTPIYREGSWYAKIKLVIASLTKEAWDGTVNVTLKKWGDRSLFVQRDL